MLLIFKPTSRVIGMTPRRPRGSVQQPLAVGFSIETQANKRLTHVAKRMGVSRSFLIQRLIEHADEELESTGDLAWWPREEELPLDRA
jgi:hypothetical protein